MKSLLLNALVIIAFFTLFSSIETNTLYAQTSLGGIVQNLNLSLVPPRPRAFEKTVVSIENYSADFSRSEVSWFLNGTLQKRGIGERFFNFTTGKLGEVSTILVTVQSPSGLSSQQILNVRPAEVILVPEAQSYTPPFYKGRALYPFQGSVKIVALPVIITEEGRQLGPKDLIFKWKKGETVLNSASGYGKDSITLAGRGTLLNPIEVSVEVTSFDKVSVAEARMDVNPIQPQLVFYENHPLYGTLYNKALRGNVTLSGQEINIEAIPFFFDIADKESGTIGYEWSLNSSSVNKNQNSLVFRADSENRGTATISATISHVKKIFQSAANNLSLTFDNTLSNNSESGTVGFPQ